MKSKKKKKINHTILSLSESLSPEIHYEGLQGQFQPAYAAIIMKKEYFNSIGEFWIRISRISNSGHNCHDVIRLTAVTPEFQETCKESSLMNVPSASDPHPLNYPISSSSPVSLSQSNINTKLISLYYIPSIGSGA